MPFDPPYSKLRDRDTQIQLVRLHKESHQIGCCFDG